MPAFIVDFAAPGRVSTTIEAEYYRHEDGWTTFKDADHKVVHDLPDHVIRSIRRENTATTLVNEVHIHGAVDPADRVRFESSGA